MGDGEAQKLISRCIKQFRSTFTFEIYHHAHRFFFFCAPWQRVIPLAQNVMVLELHHYASSCTGEFYYFISNLASTFLNTRTTMQ